MGMKERKQRRSTAAERGLCRGLTLLETLIAMGIFALGLLTLMPLSVATIRANDLAAARTRAVSLAQAKLEDFHALPYGQVTGIITGREVLREGFVRRWGVADTPSVPGDGNDLRRLWVEVSWGTAPPHSVSLVTSRSRY